jgi:hypothetical protein
MACTRRLTVAELACIAWALATGSRRKTRGIGMSEPTRIALVSGANRGLGLGTARQLAQLGYTVVLGARDRKVDRLRAPVSTATQPRHPAPTPGPGLRQAESVSQWSPHQALQSADSTAHSGFLRPPGSQACPARLASPAGRVPRQAGRTGSASRQVPRHCSPRGSGPGRGSAPGRCTTRRAAV